MSREIDSQIDEEEDNISIDTEDKGLDRRSENVSELSEDEGSPWIQWFISLRGNDFFCAVDEEFIQDEFNLTGLYSMVKFNFLI